MQYGNGVRCVLFLLALAPGGAVADDDAAFASFFGSVPKTMTTGETRTVTILMRNAGDSTWTRAEGFELGAEDPSDNTTWGLSRVEIDDAVAVEPEAAYTFSFAITAPSTAGEHAFQWRMVHDGTRFGGKTPSKTITVTPPPNDAAFASYRAVPASMTAGETAKVAVTMQNTGTATWTGGEGYKLASRTTPSDLWGVSQATLPDGASVPPKAFRSFALTITAPATAGDHAFQWQMEQNGAAFGATTTSQTITVTPVNTAPVVALAIDDMTLTVGGRSETVDLSLHFSDPEQDEMTYTVSSAAPAVVTAALADNLLTLTAAAVGTADVTVTATDASGLASAPDVFTVTATSPVDVTIPDANLRTAIEWRLGKKAEETITSAEMEHIASLYCSNCAIRNLTGLEFATGLEDLVLPYNGITDATPLSELTRLTSLNLDDNAITEATPVADLHRLATLNLGRNKLADLTSLSGLTDLTELDLYHNEIRDIAPLSGLTELTTLNLSGNKITDLTPLSGLTKLTSLSLYNNAITDIAPLSGTTNLTMLDLRGNKITNLTPLSGLTSLTRLSVANNAITDVVPLSGLTSLSDLNLYSNAVTSLSPLSGLTNLTRLNLVDNAITDATPLSGLSKLSLLSLRGNSITDVAPLSGLNELTTLDLTSNAITDVTPLSGLINLTFLQLYHNAVADITALSGLSKLEGLYLAGNEITDVSPLSGLTNLTGLYLSTNNITDIAPLSGLTKLISLSLSSNAVSNVTPLSGLVDLEDLWLFSNSINNLSPLSGLSKLTTLHLATNGIADVSPLSALTELTRLYLQDNAIADMTPLSDLTDLETLWLFKNSITDASPLSGLTDLTWLHLDHNGIADVTPLSGLTQLQRLDLDSNCLTSIGGLTSNTGLDSGDYLSLEWNPLDAQTLANDVTALRERGVTVAVSETPSDVLGAPRSLSATPGDGELALTWFTPSGSVKPVAYELRWRSAAGTFNDWAVVPCSAKRSHKLTGLTNGTTYTVEVRAAGNAGNGVATTTGTPGNP